MGNVGGSLFSNITESTLAVDEILSSPYTYEQKLVKIIHGDIAPSAKTMSEVHNNSDKVIKIEGYEKFNRVLFDACKDLCEIMEHDGPVTCHLFLSPKGSKSFPQHTDPDDVYVYMIKGSKHMIVDGKVVRLSKGDSLFIPRNTPHYAINMSDSIMLSFGLELFTVDKLYGV